MSEIPTYDELALEERMRRIAREEIASLAGLVVRRTQDETLNDEATADALARIFGEALNDFTTDTEPGR